jgi:hypothetical protein
MTKKKNQFATFIGGARGEFVARAFDSVPGLTRGGLTTKLIVKWAEGVLGEKAPDPSPRGRHFADGANPNGLTATARRLGIKPAELRQRLIKEALERLASNKTAAE